MFQQFLMIQYTIQLLQILIEFVEENLTLLQQKPAIRQYAVSVNIFTVQTSSVLTKATVSYEKGEI